MQTLDEYAAKSGVMLEKKGNCQFCRSRVTGGVYECFEIFQKVVGEASNLKSVGAQVQLIIVDAHALQHSEVHGVRNNNYHLLRLLGIYEYGTSSRIGTNYSFLSPMLNPRASVLHLESPPAGERGITTISDVAASTDSDRSIGIIRNWGKEVFDAWGAYRCWAEEEWSKLRV